MLRIILVFVGWERGEGRRGLVKREVAFGSLRKPMENQWKAMENQWASMENQWTPKENQWDSMGKEWKPKEKQWTSMRNPNI